MVTATESIFINHPVPLVFNTAVNPEMQLLWDKNFKHLKNAWSRKKTAPVIAVLFPGWVEWNMNWWNTSPTGNLPIGR